VVARRRSAAVWSAVAVSLAALLWRSSSAAASPLPVAEVSLAGVHSQGLSVVLKSMASLSLTEPAQSKPSEAQVRQG